ncbi:MAG: SagB/ThcOx family dehydrogenase [Brevinematales bacterium]|nr:SagB/ThcOx family dehydrogenase [Brevinematales bacterium]
MLKSISLLVLLWCVEQQGYSQTMHSQREWLLPSPSFKGETSLEETIFRRKSLREYQDIPLTLGEVSQLLWAAAGKTLDGITGPSRSHPSAGGLYPIEIYLVVSKGESLKPGIYHYQWWNHSLTILKEGEYRHKLSSLALGQQSVARAPVTFVFTAVFQRTTKKYGKRGELYVPLDIGAAAENMWLQATSLGLGTVWIGAFDTEGVKQLLDVPSVEPLLLLPVGKPLR